MGVLLQVKRTASINNEGFVVKTTIDSKGEKQILTARNRCEFYMNLSIIF
jgi:hypothetical protein